VAGEFFVNFYFRVEAFINTSPGEVKKERGDSDNRKELSVVDRSF